MPFSRSFRKRGNVGRFAKKHLAEPLEPRIFLSITAAIIAGPETTPGNQWTYGYTSPYFSNGETETKTVNVVGATTISGQAGYELDSTDTDTYSGGSNVTTTRQYLVFNSQGLYDYSDTGSFASGGTVDSTNSHMYEPALMVAPASLSVGSPVTGTSTDNSTNTILTSDESNNKSRMISNTLSLASDMTKPIDAGAAGSFDCYEVDQTLIWTTIPTDGSTPIVTTINDTVFVSPGVGIVQLINNSTTTNGGGSQYTQTLTSFNGGDHLAFQQPPSDGTAKQVIKPAVTVALEDSSGNVLTDGSGTVTLSPVGFNSDKPISGNTATMANGVAKFSDLTLQEEGFYQLQASDDNDDAVVTSGKFKIAGDKLKILAQPKNTDANTAIPLTVEILDSTGKLDTDATSTIVLSLNPAQTGSAATLGGTVSAQFVGGKATFTSTNGPKIDTPGKYTFTLTEEDLSTGVLTPTNTTTAVTTNQFAIAGLQLAFAQKPATSDVAQKLSFSIAEEDSKKKKQTTIDDGGVSLSFTPVSNTSGQLSSYIDAGFKSGLDTFATPNSPSFNFPGTYTLTATALDSNGVPDASVASASVTVKIVGLQIEFAAQPPADVPLYKYIPLKLEVKNSKGKLDTDVSESLRITVDSSSLLLQGTSIDSDVFTGGTFEMAQAVSGGLGLTSVPSAYFSDVVGTTTLTFAALLPDGSPDLAIASATSRAIKVTGYHVEYTAQPVNESVRFLVPCKIAIEDDHGNILQDDSNHHLVGQSGPLSFQVKAASSPAGISAPFNNDLPTTTDGTYDFPILSADLHSNSGGLLALETGTFDVTVTVITASVTDQPLSDSFAPGVSHKFKIFGDRIGFSVQPTGISVSFKLPPFTVDIESIDGEINTFDPATIVDATYRSTRGGPAQQLGSATAVDGYAQFQLLEIPDPGTYIITVSQDPAQVALENSNGLTILPDVPGISTPFTMST